MIKLTKIIQPATLHCNECNTPYPIWHMVYTPRDIDIHYDFCPLCLNNHLLKIGREYANE